MKLTTGFSGRAQAIVDLVAATFTDSEGADEGALIGGLVRDLLAGTQPADIRVFCAGEGDRLIGVAIFTRLTYSDDPRRAMLLSPVAVATGRQRQGVGRALIHGALEALRAEGVQVAVTYGDPDYYRQVGLMPITEDQAAAPLPLSHPPGWLWRSLTDGRAPVLRGASTCVPALNRAGIW